MIVLLGIILQVLLVSLVHRELFRQIKTQHLIVPTVLMDKYRVLHHQELLLIGKDSDFFLAHIAANVLEFCQ